MNVNMNLTLCCPRRAARFCGDILRAHNLAAHLRAWIIIVHACDFVQAREHTRINIDAILEYACV